MHVLMHTIIVDKSNFKKPVVHWHVSGMKINKVASYIPTVE